MRLCSFVVVPPLYLPCHLVNPQMIAAAKDSRTNHFMIVTPGERKSMVLRFKGRVCLNHQTIESL